MRRRAQRLQAIGRQFQHDHLLAAAGGRRRQPGHARALERIDAIERQIAADLDRAARQARDGTASPRWGARSRPCGADCRCLAAGCGRRAPLAWRAADSGTTAPRLAASATRDSCLSPRRRAWIATRRASRSATASPASIRPEIQVRADAYSCTSPLQGTRSRQLATTRDDDAILHAVAQLAQARASTEQECLQAVKNPTGAAIQMGILHCRREGNRNLRMPTKIRISPGADPENLT